MTISTTSRRSIGLGNGATTVWPYAFLIPLASELSVIYTNPNRDAIDPLGTGVVLNPATYSVTGIGNPAGGNVTYPLSGPAVAAPITITVLRTIPMTQPTTLQNQGASYPLVTETAMDNLEMQIQQINEIFLRTFSLPVGFDQVAAGISLTLPTPVANTVLGWDSTGKNLINLASVPSVVIPATVVGQVVFGAAGNSLAQDANLFWDNTNKRLGIGTATPGYPLEVAGTITATGGLFRTISAPGASKFAYLLAQGTTAGSVAKQGYFGVNAFSTDGSVDIAESAGLGMKITQGTGAVTFSNSVVTPLVANAGQLDIKTTTNNQIAFSINSGQVWAIAGASRDWLPTNDNIPSIGGPSNRVFAIFTTIVDSGAATGVDVRTNNGSLQLRVQHVAGTVVNRVEVAGNVTGGRPSVVAQGEAGVGVVYGSGGTGSTMIVTSGTLTQGEFLHTAGSARWPTFTGSAAGNPQIGTNNGGIDFMPGTVRFPSIGTTAVAANATLNAVGSNDLLRSTSSKRYKNVLRDFDLNAARALILGPKPVVFESRAEADWAGEEHVGFLAEDVAAIDPRFATFDERGRPDWVQYPTFVVPLSLMAADHERRIAALEKAMQH
jgi:hypothetical protein